MPYAIRRLAIPAAFLLLAWAQLALSARLRALDVPFVSPGESGERRWNPKLFQIASFGHLPAVIDWIWIQSMVDPATARLPKGMHSDQYYRFDLMTELDPANFQAYFVGSTLLSIIRDDPRGALDLLAKAERFQNRELAAYGEGFRKREWAGGWYLRVIAGYIHLFELDDLASAAEAFRQGARLPDAPPYLLRLAERLNRDGGEYEVGLKLLNFMITQASDGRARARLEKQRQSLFVAQHIAELNRAFFRYLSQNSRYKVSQNISPREMQAFWTKFRKSEGLSLRDPWGGTLSVDGHGRIVTTTRYERVFGLD